MLNGNSTYSNSNSFDLKPNSDGRDLPWVFRFAMPIPVTLVSGI